MGGPALEGFRRSEGVSWLWRCRWCGAVGGCPGCGFVGVRVVDIGHNPHDNASNAAVRPCAAVGGFVGVVRPRRR